MSESIFARNNQRVSEALAAGQRLHVGVTLSYVGGSSDKFWTGVWAQDRIAVNYGRHGSVGQFTLHDRLSEREGAAKLWGLLRAKVGKGYAVVDSAVLVLDPHTLASGGYDGAVRAVREWERLRDDRRVNPRRPVDHPELLGTSPRTATQGAQVLLDLTSATATPESLAACAVANPTERFLPPMVMSRPDLPDAVKFMAALSGNAKVVM